MEIKCCLVRGKNKLSKKVRGTTYNVVNYDTASRNGEPYIQMMLKYPMPNNFASNCTRELKQNTIHKFVKSLGYKEVTTAMGS